MPPKKIPVGALDTGGEDRRVGESHGSTASAHDDEVVRAAQQRLSREAMAELSRLQRDMDLDRPEPFTNDVEVLNGQTVFTGTHVPLEIVKECRDAELPIEEFLTDYLDVRKWQAEYAWSLGDAELDRAINHSQPPPT